MSTSRAGGADRRSAGDRPGPPGPRLLLAVSTLTASVGLTVLLLRAGVPLLGWAAVGLSAIAVVDVIAVFRQRRRTARD